MTEVEPPSSNVMIFLVGRNSRGHWVAQERNGLYGGLFVSRAAAISYALFENGHNPAAVISTAEVIELRIPGRQARSAPVSGGGRDPANRQAA